MAKSAQANDDPTNDHPEKPNHMIIWLDDHIGKPNEYMHLKKAFGSNTDPRHETWTMLNDEDYGTMIATKASLLVSFEGVIFLLQAFDKEADCLNAFEKNQDKRIFFITSGKLGKSIVPKLIERYRPIFTDPINNTPYASVYVFCLHIDYHMDWGYEYAEYVQMFNAESELLERMTRDIAEYFIMRGERLRQGNDLKGALQRLNWSKRLWHQYDKMQQQIKTDERREVRASKRMLEIEALIANVEAELPVKSSDDENASSDDEDKGRAPQ